MKRNIKGQSLFEVVVALAMAAMIIVSVVVLATLSMQSSAFSKNKTLATRYGQDAIEWLRGQRDNTTTFWDNVEVGNRCLVELVWTNLGNCDETEVITNTQFQRQVSFTSIVDSGVEAKVIVSWTDAKGYHESQTNTIFSDWRNK
jgi:Tfp pilus assembly protein PilV